MSARPVEVQGEGSCAGLQDSALEAHDKRKGSKRPQREAAGDTE